MQDSRMKPGFRLLASRCTARNVSILLLLLVVFFLPAMARAQVAGGSVTGTARGESGAAMPGVQVSTRDVTTGDVRTVTTDTDGLYSIPALPPGSYEMTVSAPGFVTQVSTGVTVAVGTERVFNIVMRAGSPDVVVRTAAPIAPLSQGSSS